METKKFSRYNFAGIYQILNLVNGKRYVGQAQNITNRWYDHHKPKNLSKTIPLYRAIKKYGWKSFEFSVLEKVDDISKLNEREQFWIDTLEVCDENKGYNICVEAGTTRGRNHTTEAIEKIRAAASQRIGEANSFTGKSHTEETKAKISKANKGRKWTREQHLKFSEARDKANGFGRPKRKVCQIDLETGEIEKVWDSASEAAKAMGTTQSTITGVCLGYRGKKTAKGWGWRYLED